MDLASPQTSFGIRSLRIHREKWMGDERTAKDVCGEAIMALQEPIIWCAPGLLIEQKHALEKFLAGVYGKRQTRDSSWEIFEMRNEQIKTAQNNSYG